MLLKSFDPEGFVFFTNYGSRKAREIEARSRPPLEGRTVEALPALAAPDAPAPEEFEPADCLPD